MTKVDIANVVEHKIQHVKYAIVYTFLVPNIALELEMVLDPNWSTTTGIDLLLGGYLEFKLPIQNFVSVEAHKQLRIQLDSLNSFPSYYVLHFVEYIEQLKGGNLISVLTVFLNTCFGICQGKDNLEADRECQEDTKWRRRTIRWTNQRSYKIISKS